MKLHITPKSGLPLYLQIVGQVKYLVASGRLAPGDELPPIRALAEQLVINPNTVARAYRELEAAGIVVSRVGAGTYVSADGSPWNRRERMRLLTERADALLAEAKLLGFELDEVVDLLRNRHGDMEDGAGAGPR